MRLVGSFETVGNPFWSKRCSFGDELYFRMISFACFVSWWKLLCCHVGHCADALEGILNGTVFERRREKQIQN